MTKADTIFKENITKIMEEGVWSEQARPKYKDGTTANSKYMLSGRPQKFPHAT